MTFLRRLLRRQDGITLVMAVGILGVLTVSGTTLIYYSSTNARSVSYSTANASAYDLAESGINEMMSILSKPDNNALNKYLLGEQANGTVTPVIDRRYSLSEVREAIRYLGEGHARGKVVIVVEPDIKA